MAQSEEVRLAADGERIASLEADVARLGREVAGKDERVAALEADLAAARADNRNADEEYRSLLERYRGQEQTIAVTAERLSSFQLDVEDVQAEAAALRTREAALLSEKGALQDDIGRLQRRLSEADDALDDARARERAYADTIAELEEVLQDKVSEAETAQADAAYRASEVQRGLATENELRAALSAERKKAKEIGLEAVTLRSRANGAANQVRDLEAALDDAEARIRSQADELDRMTNAADKAAVQAHTIGRLEAAVERESGAARAAQDEARTLRERLRKMELEFASVIDRESRHTQELTIYKTMAGSADVGSSSARGGAGGGSGGGAGSDLQERVSRLTGTLKQQVSFLMDQDYASFAGGTSDLRGTGRVGRGGGGGGDGGGGGRVGGRRGY